MVAGGAAVDAGLIRSLAKPGGNVTGVALQVNPDLSDKRLEFLKAASTSLLARADQIIE